MIRRLTFIATAAAKSVSHIPAQCSGDTIAYSVFMSQGSRTTLGFGANNAGNWTITADDADGTRLINYTGDLGQAWEVVTFRDLARGFHSVSYNVTNNVTGETCTSQVSWKV